MRNSKLIVSAAIAISALVGIGAASAADLPARTYTKAPMMVDPSYNWSGFYFGLNGGGGSAHDCFTVIATSLVGVLNPPQADGCNNGTGGTVGGQVGYRWQVTNWVFGLEAQGNWANFVGHNVGMAPIDPPGFQNNNSKIDAFGLFTGQLGYAFNNVLIYAKGGAAVVSDKYSTSIIAALPAIGPQPAIAAGQTLSVGSETRWGGVVGAGVEFGFAPRWSVALEYDHAFMGSRNVTLFGVPPSPAGSSASYSIKQDIDIGTVRLNYTFGGPVVARY